MPRGETSYMMLSDFSTGYVESLTFAGAIKFCARPPAGNPKWVLIASDAGEIRVFNESGLHQPAYDIDLGWNPDQVSLNNETPPKILIRRHGTLTIYLYESGAESWNVAGITNMIEALISTGYVHTCINNTASSGASGAEWRSLTDGSIVQATYGIGGGTIRITGGLAVTEAGEIVYHLSRSWTSGPGYTTHVHKMDKTAGTVWKNSTAMGADHAWNLRVLCCADGSLAIVDYYGNPSATTFVVLHRGSDGVHLHDDNDPARYIYRLAVNPAGTRAGYLHEDDLHRVTVAGVHTTVVMGSNHAGNMGCLDISDDPSFVCVLDNGDMEIYDDGLVKKATIDYELGDSPVAVVRNT